MLYCNYDQFKCQYDVSVNCLLYLCENFEFVLVFGDGEDDFQFVEVLVEVKKVICKCDCVCLCCGKWIQLQVDYIQLCYVGGMYDFDNL